MIFFKNSHSRRNKKAYFFTLDALMALTILTVGIVYVYLNYSYSPIESVPLTQAEELMNFLTSTKVNEINNKYLDNLRIDSSVVVRAENTLMEQIITMKDRHHEKAQNLTRNITQALIPEQFGVEISADCFPIDEQILFYQNRTGNKSQSKLLIPSRRMVFARETKFKITSCSVEVQVWQ